MGSSEDDVPDGSPSPKRLSVYFQRLEELEKERHQERTQILIATAVLGASITLFVNNLLQSDVLIYALLIFGAINFLFLLFKLTINTTTPITDWAFLRRIDPYAPLPYLLSIYGFSTILVVEIISRQLEISLSQSDMGLAVGFILEFIVIFGFFYLVSKRQQSVAQRKREMLLEEVPKILDIFEGAGIIDASKRQSLQQRFDNVISKDERIGLFGHSSIGSAQNLKLRRNDMDFLINLIERVKTKAEHNQVNEDDLNPIEETLEQAEERTYSDIR